LLIIFDLDGTLIDSSEDLAISMNATRNYLGLPPIDPKLIYSYVGNGAPLLVRRALPPDSTDDLVQDALGYFLKFYRAHALEHTRLYPGVRKLIEDLSAAQHRLAVLTNKPTRISVDIIAALGLASYFLQIYGGDSLRGKKPDPIGITSLMQETGTAAGETLMVGDSAVDVQTARNAGVRSCGVLWGFQPESFEQYRPDFVIRSASELLAHVNVRHQFVPGNSMPTPR
jgi:phosphoglycolate phosphatase